MKLHVSQPDSVPLLIFPEGTCVNNEYSVLFKRGAFELGAAVCPVAIRRVRAGWGTRASEGSHKLGASILRLMPPFAGALHTHTHTRTLCRAVPRRRYNKIFVDAFWNSRRQTFSQHMLKLMNSWATVCDVWFLEPQVGWGGVRALRLCPWACSRVPRLAAAAMPHACMPRRARTGAGSCCVAWWPAGQERGRERRPVCGARAAHDCGHSRCARWSGSLLASCLCSPDWPPCT